MKYSVFLLLFLCLCASVTMNAQPEITSDNEVVTAAKVLSGDAVNIAIMPNVATTPKRANFPVHHVQDWKAVDEVGPENATENRKRQFAYYQLPTDDEPPNDGGTVIIEPEPELTFFEAAWDYIKSNWIMVLFALLGFVETLVLLTPTERDNAAFKWLYGIITTIIPNNKTGGGTHSA